MTLRGAKLHQFLCVTWRLVFYYVVEGFLVFWGALCLLPYSVPIAWFGVRYIFTKV